MHEIAVLEYRFSSEIQTEIQALASNKIAFPVALCPQNERVSRTGKASIALVTPWDKIDAAYLDACPQLRYVGLCGTSTANIDLQELKRRGIAFSNVVSNNKQSVAEFFFMQLVSLARGLGEYQWKKGEQHELAGKRIGIIGLGAVGQAVAHLALAYKMDIAYHSPHRKQAWEDKGLMYLDKKELLRTSDIVVLCAPTNVEVLGAPEFQAIQQGKILVQASSGNPFNQTAFYNWIAKEGNYAIFDMSAGEDNCRAYRDIPGVIFSTVVAGDTYESNVRRGQHVIQNLKHFLDIE